MKNPSIVSISCAICLLLVGHPVAFSQEKTESRIKALESEVGPWRWLSPDNSTKIIEELFKISSEASLKSDHPLAMRALSLAARASRNPQAIAAQAHTQIKALDLKSTWQKGITFSIEDYATACAIPASLLADSQGRETTIDLKDGLLRAKMTPSRGPGRTLLGLSTPGLRMPTSHFKIGIEVNGEIPPHTWISLSFHAKEAARNLSRSFTLEKINAHRQGEYQTGWIAPDAIKEAMEYTGEEAYITSVAIDFDEGPKISLELKQFFLRFPPDATEKEAQPETASPSATPEIIDALGYLAAAPRQSEGITTISRIQEDKMAPGPTLFLSGHFPEASLIASDGTVLHQWRTTPILAENKHPIPWRRARITPEGDLIAIRDRLDIQRVNARSEVVWRLEGQFHHDAFLSPDGTIQTLLSEEKTPPRFGFKTPAIDDLIATLSPSGELLSTLSILECIEFSDFAPLFWMRLRPGGDILHTNSIEVLDGRFASQNPAFKKGNVLLSVRELSAVVVIDPDKRKVVWAMQGAWILQHTPSLLDNGNLLVFDNRGLRNSRPSGVDISRVLEINLATQGIAWEFRGTRKEPFFSMTGGNCQRLSNGNTLITESDNGRVLEVAQSGEIVWELNNPNTANGGQVASIPDAYRLPPDFPMDWATGPMVE